MNNEQGSLNKEKIISKQWIMNDEQWTVNKEQWTMNDEQWKIIDY